MDEVENPALPAAGESSPTLGPATLDSPKATGEDGKITDAHLALHRANEDGASVDDAAAAALSLPVRHPPERDDDNLPPTQPPPAPPPPDPVDEPPDSLTLADLKRIRSAFPPQQSPPRPPTLADVKVYDFEPRDAQSLPVELEEWFGYSDQEELLLRKCKAMFNQEWRTGMHCDMDWLDVTEDERRAFVKREVEALETDTLSTSALMVLTYVGLGVWEETAGRQEGCALEDLFPGGNGPGMWLDRYRASGLQVQWIVAMVDTIHACDGLKAIYDALRKSCEASFDASSPGGSVDQSAGGNYESTELWCCLTLMYIFIEVARTTEGTSGRALKRDILALEPQLLNYFTEIVARLRWDDSAPVPLTKMLLLAWKAVLVTLGGLQDVEAVKASLRRDENPHDSPTTAGIKGATTVDKSDTSNSNHSTSGQPIITASPLDYHLFRQEISSKYPAYQPPPPLFPIEPDNNSILPPLKHRLSCSASTSDTSVAAAASSIMHQPVHIATPAPSPPPSPAVPGKGGKKQNYQTNQLFPFLYPPLDGNSSALGGKGSTRLQDALVGERWAGADIPASIIEAADLFANRMRAPRAMRQLWDVRVEYMEFERGWKSEDLNAGVKEEGGFETTSSPAAPESETAPQGKPFVESEATRKLRAVDRFYRSVLPYLQSVVLVLLRAMEKHIADLLLLRGATNGQGSVGGAFPSFPPESGAITNGGAFSAENSGPHEESPATSESLDLLRAGEIQNKAISSLLLLLAKWFKANHILQHEYFTSLLLDAHYIPLTLRLWQAQEMGRACHVRSPERVEARGFWWFCRGNSRAGLPTIGELPGNLGGGTVFEEEEEEEEAAAAVAEGNDDEAVPPPILRRKDEAQQDHQQQDFQHPPEVDELGYPLTPLPRVPLREYSWRQIATTVNFLRVLQKVTRRKTHRALMLVSLKSSNPLRRLLRIPVPLVRLYALKLFKAQVPFCGRKWRQSNMKIITAIYLSVPAELRDDYLTGGGGGMGGACVGDVDGTVEDAVPLEQSLRALTHWWNVRNYGKVGKSDEEEGEEEDDFFGRELERLEGMRDEGDEEGVGEVVGGEEIDAGAGWAGPLEGY
ncbi:hypothetical protein M433DRAFT_149976 [Acidomyces richmondensis BFW]|nr:MAG: hypothetical protein FE78DRAFT_93417 [Acidomyces sp. 'richmondensis']KYG49470.1 hypothetical protein M433DRAFT_149976 [Acidomyces richmondensis BFW]